MFVPGAYSTQEQNIFLRNVTMPEMGEDDCGVSAVLGFVHALREVVCNAGGGVPPCPPSTPESLKGGISEIINERGKYVQGIRQCFICCPESRQISPLKNPATSRESNHKLDAEGRLPEGARLIFNEFNEF